MCDGQPADNCDFMKLPEFEYHLNVRLTKVNKQFATMHDVLEAKKEALIKIYRKDPRISHDDAVTSLQRTIEAFDLLRPEKEQNVMQQKLVELQKKLTQQQGIISQLESSLSGRVVHCLNFFWTKLFDPILPQKSRHVI